MKLCSTNLLFVGGVLALTALVVPLNVFAAGGHGGGHGSFWDLKWFILNFTIYCVALYFILRKKVAAGWSARVARLEAEVASRAAELKAAEAELRAAELQLQSLDGEIRSLKEQVARETEHEARQITTDAAKRAERIEGQTKDSLRAERRAAEFAVQRELANTVVKRAEEKLKATLNADSDKALRARALDGVKQLVQQ
jgi:F0F1-type ATP synthase membrane subunit b/b'